jgi:hypothetical protein
MLKCGVLFFLPSITVIAKYSLKNFILIPNLIKQERLKLITFANLKYKIVFSRR